MAKGKDIVADNEHDHTFDEDINLEDGYHDDLMANNADLEDEKNKANLDGADLNGIEFDGADFDGTKSVLRASSPQSSGFQSIYTYPFNTKSKS